MLVWIYLLAFGVLLDLLILVCYVDIAHFLDHHVVVSCWWTSGITSHHKVNVHPYRLFPLSSSTWFLKLKCIYSLGEQCSDLWEITIYSERQSGSFIHLTYFPPSGRRASTIDYVIFHNIITQGHQQRTSITFYGPTTCTHATSQSRAHKWCPNQEIVKELW